MSIDHKIARDRARTQKILHDTMRAARARRRLRRLVALSAD